MSYLCHYYLTYGRYSYSPMLPTSSIFPLSIKPGKGQNTAIGNIMCIFLPSLPPYLPYTTGSSPSSYHSNTGWCCFPLACIRHGTEMKIIILYMKNECWVVYLKFANLAMIQLRGDNLPKIIIKQKLFLGYSPFHFWEHPAVPCTLLGYILVPSSTFHCYRSW